MISDARITPMYSEFRAHKKRERYFASKGPAASQEEHMDPILQLDMDERKKEWHLNWSQCRTKYRSTEQEKG